MLSSGRRRRVRRAEQRRQEILKAAASVFARKGYEKATTREIARAADVSEGTIYNYFASKKDLLLALADMIEVQLEEVIAGLLAEGDDRGEIVRGIDRVLATIADNAVVIRGLVAALWDPAYGFTGYLIPGSQKLIARIESRLQAGIDQGRMRAHDTRTVARMVVGMVVFLAVPYLRGLEAIPSAEERCKQAELLVGVLFDGLQV